MGSGVQYVTMVGIQQMPLQYASNLAMHTLEVGEP